MRRNLEQSEACNLSLVLVLVLVPVPVLALVQVLGIRKGADRKVQSPRQSQASYSKAGPRCTVEVVRRSMGKGVVVVVVVAGWGWHFD